MDVNLEHAECMGYGNAGSSADIFKSIRFRVEPYDGTWPELGQHKKKRKPSQR